MSEPAQLAGDSPELAAIIEESERIGGRRHRLERTEDVVAAAAAQDRARAARLGLEPSLPPAFTRRLDARCTTVSTNATAGDERYFARKTAGHLGLSLSERRFELAAIDLEKSAAAGLPRPVARAFEYVRSTRRSDMERDDDVRPDLIDLGSASVETKGLSGMIPDWAAGQSANRLSND